MMQFWVVVDRLTKSAHFLPIQQGYSGSKLAEIFQQEIIRLHGTPASIVSDRDPRFASTDFGKVYNLKDMLEIIRFRVRREIGTRRGVWMHPRESKHVSYALDMLLARGGHSISGCLV
ncbi:transposon ty3-I gag-pol polyprotein [Tanacetum coccineum]|uniref:Transposon ty3-I gag-pol polyprotein n=1 Tax=Tanacetum coccineum TaxID=301880 RepID=A0ABQ4Y9J8_9ASTR